MAFTLHPILGPEQPPRPGVWYVLSPEDSSQCPSSRVGACANFLPGEEGGKVLISAGATPEGPLAGVYELHIGRDSYNWYDLPSQGLPPRYEHAAFLVDNELHVFGGAQQTGPLNDIWRFNRATGQWSSLQTKGSVPTPRTCHSSTSVGDGGTTLFVYSGGSTGSDATSDERVYLFDTVTLEWSCPPTIGHAPPPRQGHISVVMGNKLIIHGGMAGQQIYDDLWILDLVKSGHCRRQTLFCIGHHHKPTAVMETFPLGWSGSADNWNWTEVETKGSHPPPLAAHGCAFIRRKLYVFGGLSPEGACDELYCLDTDTMEWQKVAVSGPPPPARLDHCMCTIMIPLPSKEGATAATNSQLPSPGTGEAPVETNPAGTKPDGGAATCTTITLIGPEITESQDVAVSTGAGVQSQQRIEKLVEDLHISGDRPSTAVFVPALFVFAGVDTRGTVHGDSFIFVPSA